MEELTNDEKKILEYAMDKPIAYRPLFAKIFGSVTTAILLSQYYYWTENELTQKRDGWFFKTEQDLYNETGLGKYEQRLAREKLEGLGVLEKERRGLPAKNWYRINVKNLVKHLTLERHGQLSVLPTTSGGENPLLEVGKTHYLKLGKPTTITENTTETTTENTTTPKNFFPNNLFEVKNTEHCTNKKKCGVCAKCSLNKCTDNEIWEISTHLNIPQSYVETKHAEIMRLLQTGEFQTKYKKHKTVYYTLIKWLQMSKEKGYIPEMNEMEQMIHRTENPERLNKLKQIIKIAKQNGVL